MIDVSSTSTLFVVSFLGAMFAIVVSLLIVYTYVMLRLVPRLKSALREFVREIGPRAVFEQANLDPAEAMRQLGISPSEEAAAAIIQEAAAAIHQRGAAAAGSVVSSDLGTAHVVFTCEDHGRCVGCPRVLAQFEAIIQHQGEASFNDVERTCYAQLRKQLTGDAALDGESEASRQKRLATRVVDALVVEGFAPGAARGVVWAISKEQRATFAAWLSAARQSCKALAPIQDEEKVA